MICLVLDQNKNKNVNKDASISKKKTIFGVCSFAANSGRKTPVGLPAENDASIGRKCRKCARVMAALLECVV